MGSFSWRISLRIRNFSPGVCLGMKEEFIWKVSLDMRGFGQRACLKVGDFG